MHAAIDFGTSNCTAGFVVDGKPTLIELEKGSSLMPTALYVQRVPVTPNPIHEGFFQDRMKKEKKIYIKEVFDELYSDEKIKQSKDIKYEIDTDLLKQKAENRWKEHEVTTEALVRSSMKEENRKIAQKNYRNQSFSEAVKLGGKLLFGSEAIEAYIDDSENGIFFASPKSFIGADIPKQYQTLFTLMITQILKHIKSKLEDVSTYIIEQVVIGRPLRFHGSMGDSGNEQALNILRNAAISAGFKEVNFLEEPIAAAFYYEKQLSNDKTVLVIDIGGGTTDCSVVKLGPSFSQDDDKGKITPGLSGDRIGGIDIDIDLLNKLVMPYFGKGGAHKHDKIPNKVFFDAVMINDLQAQKSFSSAKMKNDIEKYYRLSDDVLRTKLSRLITLQEDRLQFRLKQSAEEVKIALSHDKSYGMSLDYIENSFNIEIKEEVFSKAITATLDKMVALMKKAQEKSQEEIDVVYVTGGTAKSPIVRQKIKETFDNVEIIIGDYFGSVGLGLVHWADRKY